MKKTGVLLIAAILSLSLLLCGCGAPKLAEGFTEADVIAKAERAVTLLSTQDYDGAFAVFSPEMQKSLDAAGLEEALGTQLSALGEFKSFKSTAVSGAKNDEVGDFAVTVLVCEYAEGAATYTISIDAEGLVCGLFMK